MADKLPERKLFITIREIGKVECQALIEHWLKEQQASQEKNQ